MRLPLRGETASVRIALNLRRNPDEDHLDPADAILSDGGADISVNSEIDTADQAASSEIEPAPIVALFLYDRIAQWLTQRVPRIAARIIIRIHRRFVGRRLVPIKLGTFDLVVSPQDNCGHNLFYYQAYEPLQVELWNKLLSFGHNSTVIDVGANIGYFSLLAAEKENVDRVLSFEPNPLVLPTLRYNATLNAYLAPKITVAEMAAGSENGSVPFYRNFDEHNFGLGSMRAQTEDSFTVDVPVVRLDSYLESQGIDRVDVIKIDVEGAEQLVVSGLTDWWASRSCPILVIEVHPKMLPDFGASVDILFATLTGAGYTLGRLCEDGQIEPDLSQFDETGWVVAEPKRQQ